MKMNKFVSIFSMIAIFLFGITDILIGATSSERSTSKKEVKTTYRTKVPYKRITPDERKAAGKRAAAQRAEARKINAAREESESSDLYDMLLSLDEVVSLSTGMDMPGPVVTPHYYGPYPNYANSPLPHGPIGRITVENGGSGYTYPVVTITDAYDKGSGVTASATVVGGVITGITLVSAGSGYYAPIVTIDDPTGVDATATAVLSDSFTGGIRKFVDSLPGLNETGKNNLNQYIPIAIPDQTTYPGCDYYEIELGQYTEKLHSDLPATTLRGYRQTNTTDATVSQYHYAGPLIIARQGTPIRIKFTNKLPIGDAGDLFLPVDTTVMGAGMGPTGEMYTQNRASVHLHGGDTVWISDGMPHQWITPAGENTPYPKGVSVVNVPNMPDPGDGAMTLYYTNGQSARLLFYHDHTYGITRLNVYAGEAADYLLTDTVEQDLINGTNNTGVNPGLQQVLPNIGFPLIIQDKTFVDANTIDFQDPNWRWGSMPGMPMTGDLWLPSVYMPAQNPDDLTGTNAFGRWQYGPWFWPPTTDIKYPPIPNPYYQPDPTQPDYAPWEASLIPDMPNPSMGMEAFMDTPVINGTAYPYMEVDPKAYRFRILNICNDRFVNLQFYVADHDVITADGRSNTEVKMVPAAATAGFPSYWPTDGRAGGVPDPSTAGPAWLQIGTEGGFLPNPVVLVNQPIAWNMNATAFNVGNVSDHCLLLGCAERADVIVDFTPYAGKTLILYNDAPAAFPALDPRYDYYTGDPDQTDTGGAPTTLAGFGPNTRTMLQIRVRGTPSGSVPVNYYNPLTLAMLKSVFAKTASKRGVFEVSHENIIVPQSVYNTAYNASFPSTVAGAYVRIYDNSKTFTPIGTTTPVTMDFEPKAIQDEMGESYDIEYGRMSGMMGLELPKTGAGNQNFMLYGYASPPVDVMQNSMTPIGTLDDGTQIWKITHNGVDTHPIHFHLFNVQLINRVAWDNAIMPPDPNEIGWKETVRMNPLEDTIVAMRPIVPTVPFDVPNSVRMIDPTMPEGAMLMGPPGGFVDPSGEAVMVMNHLVNFGWEYMWHCHILSHEEMDMMHAIAISVAPKAPMNLTGSLQSGSKVTLHWVDHSANETGFTVQRANDINFTTGVVSFGVAENVTTYDDNTIELNKTYYYRVYAMNTVGDTEIYPAPAIGFPTKTVNSDYSNTATIKTGSVPVDPTNLRANTTSTTFVILSWTDRSTDETGFYIERSDNGGTTWSRVGQTSANVTTFRNTGLTTRTRYLYRVQAYNAIGVSGYTNTLTVITR